MENNNAMTALPQKSQEDEKARRWRQEIDLLVTELPYFIVVVTRSVNFLGCLIENYSIFSGSLAVAQVRYRL